MVKIYKLLSIFILDVGCCSSIICDCEICEIGGSDSSTFSGSGIEICAKRKIEDFSEEKKLIFSPSRKDKNFTGSILYSIWLDY